MNERRKILEKRQSFLNQCLELRDSKPGSWYIFSIEVNKIVCYFAKTEKFLEQLHLNFLRMSACSRKILTRPPVIRNLKSVLFNFRADSAGLNPLKAHKNKC